MYEREGGVGVGRTASLLWSSGREINYEPHESIDYMIRWGRRGHPNRKISLVKVKEKSEKNSFQYFRL